MGAKAGLAGFNGWKAAGKTTSGNAGGMENGGQRLWWTWDKTQTVVGRECGVCWFRDRVTRRDNLEVRSKELLWIKHAIGSK
jgi:hypothetical protein